MLKVLWVLAAYLLGSIPTGYLVVKLTARRDIRTLGSRSTGATNVLRAQGWALAVPVAVFDVAKGFVPAFLSLRIFEDQTLAAVAALAAIVGHCFPVYIHFRGGKGVATAGGSILALCWPCTLICLTLFILVVAATRYVSLGSVLAAIAFPISAAALGRPPLIIGFGIAVLALVIFKHRENIVRLRNGTERRFGERLT
ncbi:MAG: glycerol-3-phosphate 1-O-acyltransferase PlsY [Candidatus Aminicenantes bacterium]|nr:glycerol-3-phosphate 1-O-acyltransferase PlsY [Candidatus Aminicenantes bacterium]